MTLLSKDLLNRVLDRLGFNELPVADVTTLRRLYASWCLNVPFDNVRKMIVLKSENKRPLPGLDVTEFFENWLKNVSSLGYQAYRMAGFMRDLGIINHGSVKVSINSQDYLADASLLLNVILPLDHSTLIGSDPVYPVELEPDGESHLVWMLTPPGGDYYYCRLIEDPVEYLLFDERYEASREQSIFNHRLYARRNYPDEMIVLWGNTRFSKTLRGVEHRDLSRDEVCKALGNDIGISDSLINEWVNSGSLNASFEPPSGTKPAPTSRKPPSQR